MHHKERKKLRKAVTTERNEVRKPYTKEIKFCEVKIEGLEADMAVKNEALTAASNAGNNDEIMALSKEVGLLQQEIDDLFERLETATVFDDEIVAEYELKLEAIDA